MPPDSVYLEHLELRDILSQGHVQQPRDGVCGIPGGFPALCVSLCPVSPHDGARRPPIPGRADACHLPAAQGSTRVRAYATHVMGGRV